MSMMGKRKKRKEVQKENEQYQLLLSNMNGGMVVVTGGRSSDKIKTTYVSSGFTEMTGYTLEDIQSRYQGDYLEVIYKDDRETTLKDLLKQIAIGDTYRLSYRIQKKDGSIIWVMDNGYLAEDENGVNNHGILTDITIIKQQEEEIRLSENRFSIAINASSGTLFEVDLKRKWYTHFENAQRIFGVGAEKLLEDTHAFSTLPHGEFEDAVTNYFFHPEDRNTSKEAMEVLRKEGTVSYEARLRRFDNRYIWARIDLSLSADENGVPLRMVGFMSDIDDIKKQAQRLESRVQTDPMTGLYNQVATATLANKVLINQGNGLHALMVLDIDDFKGINDTLGHAFGDVVLIEACTKLKALFRGEDIVGRMGGDEFAVLMKNVPDTSSVLKKAAELSKVFRQTYTGEKEDYKISCSIGIIMIQQNKESFEELYRKADAALYQAKKNGKDQLVLYEEKNAASYPIESKKTKDEELRNLKVFHNIEEHIFELLYDSKDFSISINMALSAIGQQYHVSRVAIFENDENNHTTSNIYEWCNEGISSEMQHLQNLPLTLGEESVMDCFDHNGLLYCNDVKELSPYMRQILEPQGILSSLQVTIGNGKKMYGFIGFDECKEHRVWTVEEIEKLSFLSKMLSVFLFQEKTKTALITNLNTRLKILDVLPDCICVVNPENHAIEYANHKMQTLFPLAKAGAFCFTTLRGGQEKPCETCIMERIKRGDTDNLEIISEDKNTHLRVNAISIYWTNNQKMVLLYGVREEVSDFEKIVEASNPKTEPKMIDPNGLDVIPHVPEQPIFK
ncbi:MAG: diguanylate cyclase [Lachnospiraceae bacterium]